MQNLHSDSGKIKEALILFESCRGVYALWIWRWKDIHEAKDAGNFALCWNIWHDFLQTPCQ